MVDVREAFLMTFKPRKAPKRDFDDPRPTFYEVPDTWETPDSRADGSPISPDDWNWLNRFRRMKILTMLEDAGFAEKPTIERLLALKDALANEEEVQVGLLRGVLVSNILRLMAAHDEKVAITATRMLGKLMGLDKTGALFNGPASDDPGKVDRRDTEDRYAEAKGALGLE